VHGSLSGLHCWFCNRLWSLNPAPMVPAKAIGVVYPKRASAQPEGDGGWRRGLARLGTLTLRRRNIRWLNWPFRAFY
jgi:hypothetical protein